MTPIVKNQIADQARTRGMSQDQVIKDVMLARPSRPRSSSRSKR
jgi:hypothetical protein